MPRDPEPARRKLLDAALLLFARDGIEAVSLREIRLAAGQRNAAATQYHFGTKEGLVRALVQDVLPPLVAHRRELLRGATVDDVFAVARVIVAPLTALAVGEARDRAVVRFLAELVDDVNRSWAGLTELFGDTAAAASTAMLRAALPQLPAEVMNERLVVGITGVVHACAFYARGVDTGRTRDPDLFRENLVDMFVGALTAPVSAPVSAAAREA
ncbi:TetR family transcriptional regulator [Streptodolium elevatio]|uniref:TetR family transcriptional regulator n=1 Tax=Streptodolium elevatio TaxID=3157996 RepID=A0ABV3DTR7_9ACTN